VLIGRSRSDNCGIICCPERNIDLSLQLDECLEVIYQRNWWAIVWVGRCGGFDVLMFMVMGEDPCGGTPGWWCYDVVAGAHGRLWLVIN
jgi:hypothetical protein